MRVDLLATPGRFILYTLLELIEDLTFLFAEVLRCPGYEANELIATSRRVNVGNAFALETEYFMRMCSGRNFQSSFPIECRNLNFGSQG